MRWRTKQPPKVSDKRQRKRFAWFPTHLPLMNMMVWLEFYGVEELYVQGSYDELPHWSELRRYPLDYYY